MALRLAVLAVAGLLASCGSSTAESSSSAAHPARAQCGPRSAHTLAASAVARVYAVSASVFGCSIKGHKVFALGQATSCIRSQRVAPVTVAGELAAYGLEQCGVDTGFTNVVVRRLTDGVQLRSLPGTTKPLGPESYQSVGSLVLKSDGAVAWIGVGSSIVRRGSHAEVHRADRRGQALLDSGAAIDPRSLKLHGSTLSWRHANFTRGSSLR